MATGVPTRSGHFLRKTHEIAIANCYRVGPTLKTQFSRVGARRQFVKADGIHGQNIQGVFRRNPFYGLTPIGMHDANSVVTAGGIYDGNGKK